MKKFILIGLFSLASIAFGGTGNSEDNWRIFSQASVSALSETASIINITATAGTSGKAFRVYLSSRGPETTGFYWDASYGSTATSTGVLGHYQAVSTTAILIGPFANGTVLFFQSTPGQAEANIFLTFEFQKFGDGK